MNLPESLKLAIEKEMRSLNSETLFKASQEVTNRYRDQNLRRQILNKQERFLATDAHRMAYVLARMPATFAAIQYVLNEIKVRLGSGFNSILDLGAGPGTALWAISEIFPDIRIITMLEQDQGLINLGKKLSSHSESILHKQALWMQKNIMLQETFPENDLSIVSYSMGEWPQEKLSEIVKKLWASTKQALVIIEPGTMQGFDVIRKVRQQLIDEGANMIAPCPHTLKCPMPENDWCHFSTRIQRSSLHKHVKGGSLGYEDEKFSYVAVSKVPVPLPEARILRHPSKHSGHISFSLCTKDHGLENKTISRRNGELYKLARDLEWGDTLPEE